MFLRHQLALVVFYVVVVAFILMQSKLFSLPLSFKKKNFYFLLNNFHISFHFRLFFLSPRKVISDRFEHRAALHIRYDTVRYVLYKWVWVFVCFHNDDDVFLPTVDPGWVFLFAYVFFFLLLLLLFEYLCTFLVIVVVVVATAVAFSCWCCCCWYRVQSYVYWPWYESKYEMINERASERTYEHDNEMLLATAVRSQLLHNCDDRLLPFACNASSKSIRVRYKFVENLMKWEYHTTIITKHTIFRWQRKTETERARVLNCIKKVRCLDLTDFLFGGDNVTYIYTKENYRTLHGMY